MKPDLRRLAFALALVALALFTGCRHDGDDGGNTPADSTGVSGEETADTTGGDTGEIDVLALVAEYLATENEGRRAEIVEELQAGGAAPSEVRDAIQAIDDDKPVDFTPGVSLHYPIEMEAYPEGFEDYPWEYGLYVPASYDPSRPMPLLVYPAHPTDDPNDPRGLEYWASLAEDAFLIVQVHISNIAYQNPPENYDEIVNTHAFYDHYFAVFNKAVALVKRDFAIDTSRVYSTGVSASGAGSWFNGLFSSDTYTAIAPVSVTPAPWDEKIYRNLLNTGIGVAHGDEDTITPIETVEPYIEMLSGWGYDVTFWVYEGEGHGSMFSEHFPVMAAWMLAHRRDIAPATVVKNIKTLAHAKAYWISITGTEEELSEDQPTYFGPSLAGITATRSGNAVDVATYGVTAFEISFNGAMFDLDQPLAVTVNGELLGSFPLEEEIALPLESYGRSRDRDKIWWGRVRIVLER